MSNLLKGKNIYLFNLNNAQMSVVLFGIIDHMHMLNTCVYTYICVSDSLNFELYINAHYMHSYSHAHILILKYMYELNLK